MTFPKHADGAFAETSTLNAYHALLAQGQRRPHGEALHVKRHGVWTSTTWSRLARAATLAAEGWTALGVTHEDAIVALGPLSAASLVTLFAAQALGARLEFMEEPLEAERLATARFVLAESQDEVERALRHRGRALHALVVHDARSVESVSGLPLRSFADLLGSPRESSSRRVSSAPDRAAAALPPMKDATEPPSAGEWQGLAHARYAALNVSAGERVLADFHAAWPPGLLFLLGVWAVEAPTVVLAEPFGERTTDLRESQPQLWLAPIDRLATFERHLRERVPERGYGARLARAVLAGEQPLLAGLARERIRRVTGIGRVRAVASDAGVPAATVALLRGLGLALHAGTPPVAPHTVRTAATATAQREARFTAVLSGAAH